MADYFLVKRVPGPDWDHSRRRREQVGWDDHAAFMDALAAEGLVVLGGPVGEGDGDHALLVVDADNEATIRARLAADPWSERMLATASIEPWSVWLRSPG
jgi:uncharacterized protein YciI